MELTPIKSSMIAAAGYDAERQAMRVQFKNGQVFEYAGVTAEQHQGAINADSFGAYFARYIKPEHDAKPITKDERPKCKVDGVLAPNAMCGCVTVNGSLCSSEEECEHKDPVSDKIKIQNV